MFHLAATASVPLLALVIPERFYSRTLGAVVFVALVLETLRLNHPGSNRLFIRVFSSVLKDTEKAAFTGATYFVVAAVFSFFLFGKDVALPVLLFHAVGDPDTALVADHTRGPRLWGMSPMRPVAYVPTGLVA